MTIRNLTALTSPARESSMKATPSETKLLRKHLVPSYNQQLNNFSDVPNPELMFKIASNRGTERRMHPSHYHVIKDIQDNDIRNLSKVIEKSIT
jgi:hypothetical protein